EPAGQPQVAKEDDHGDEAAGHEQAALRAEAGPEDLVEPDASVPDRVGPELDPDHEHQDEEDPEDDRDREAQAPAEAATAVAGGADGPERSAGTTASSAGPAWAGSPADRTRLVVAVVGRIGVGRSVGSVVWGRLVVSGRRLVVVGRPVVRLIVGEGPSLGRGLTAPQLLHEFVEQIGLLAASLAYGRPRPSAARRKAARTVSASSLGRIAAARIGSQRK